MATLARVLSEGYFSLGSFFSVTPLTKSLSLPFFLSSDSDVLGLW